MGKKYYYFYIMGNAYKHTVKIGLTTDIKRREYQIKHTENLQIITHCSCVCSIVDALLMEALLRKAISKQGLKHYGLDHFKATVEQYHRIRSTASDILAKCIDTYLTIDELL